MAKKVTKYRPIYIKTPNNCYNELIDLLYYKLGLEIAEEFAPNFVFKFGDKLIFIVEEDTSEYRDVELNLDKCKKNFSSKSDFSSTDANPDGNLSIEYLVDKIDKILRSK